MDTPLIKSYRLAATSEAVSARDSAEAAKAAAESELATTKEANAGYELKMKRFASVFQDAKKELETREKLVDKLSQQLKELRTDNEAKRSELFALKSKLEKRQDTEELLKCSEKKLIALEREHDALKLQSAGYAEQTAELTRQLAEAARDRAAVDAAWTERVRQLQAEWHAAAAAAAAAAAEANGGDNDCGGPTKAKKRRLSMRMSASSSPEAAIGPEEKPLLDAEIGAAAVATAQAAVDKITDANIDGTEAVSKQAEEL